MVGRSKEELKNAEKFENAIKDSGIFGEDWNKKAYPHAMEQIGLEKEVNRIKEAQKLEKKRINEKQIRSLRNRYSSRASGAALLSDNPRGVGLGEATGLPSKLGTV